jgi:hypothetical protein
MEINTNLSTTGINAAQSAQRSTPASKMLSDQVSLSNSSALEQALQNVPDSRAEMVERAKALIADPTYPSTNMMQAMSWRIAASFYSETE